MCATSNHTEAFYLSSRQFQLAADIVVAAVVAVVAKGEADGTAAAIVRELEWKPKSWNMMRPGCRRSSSTSRKVTVARYQQLQQQQDHSTSRSRSSSSSRRRTRRRKSTSSSSSSWCWCWFLLVPTLLLLLLGLVAEVLRYTEAERCRLVSP